MAIPLYKRPGYIVFLDDDADYLLNLSELLPMGWLLQLATDPGELVRRIHGEYPLLQDEVWRHQSIIEKTIDGESAIAQMLDYWRVDGYKRYTTTRLLVIDYSMPTQSGIEVLQQLTEWPGTRLMLTGQADEFVAVTAFNQGLIQQFVPKQSGNLAARLVDTIQDKLNHPLDDLGKLWRSNLTREQLALLNDPAAAAWLHSLIDKHHLVEYVVIGAPFGILGLQANSRAMWLHIEQGASTRSLEEMADSLEDSELNPQQLQEVRAGHLIVDFELQLALKSKAALRCEPAIRYPGNPNVSVAVFSIVHERCPAYDSGLERLFTESLRLR